MNPKIELVKGGRKVDGAFVANAPVSNAITADSLKPVPSFKLAPTPIPTEGMGLSAAIETNQDAFSKGLDDQRKQAEANLKTAKDPYANFLSTLQGETGLKNTAYAQEGGVDDVQTELNDINEQINAEIQSERRRQEALDKNTQGLFGGALEAEKARVNRESLAKQADLSVIQMARQGRYDSAKAIADRAVSAKLEEQRIKNDVLKFNYEENKELFTKAEQRQFESMQADRERKLNTEEATLKQISDFSIAALQAGAPTSVASAIRNAKTMNEAIALGGEYLRPKASGPDAPKLQNFGTSDAPIWKQYNTTTGEWEDVSGVSGGGVVSNETEKTRNQVSFLQDTIKDAQSLVSATGPNLITKTIGNTFVGNTRVKQLQNKIDTLKTNLLTLNSDPALKKFFGPQMTEKDTELLMSAGSTLDAYNNSVTDNEEELTRYSELLTKISKSIPTTQTETYGQSLYEPITTAPDGRQIIITD